MLRKIDSRSMGKSDLGWLNSRFHFSFAEYYNPENMNFGALRVVNDDLIRPNTGFAAHPHKDMEIVTYVVSGELTHEDCMGNRQTLLRGHMQYMSAGTGVIHSEYNRGKTQLRLLQIWILPDALGCEPRYGEYRFSSEDRANRWLYAASGEGGPAPIQLRQDMHIFVAEAESGKQIEFEIARGRQAYLALIEGAAEANGISLAERDALESTESMQIVAKTNAHIILFEMAAE